MKISLKKFIKIKNKDLNNRLSRMKCKNSKINAGPLQKIAVKELNFSSSILTRVHSFLRVSLTLKESELFSSLEQQAVTDFL